MFLSMSTPTNLTKLIFTFKRSINIWDIILYPYINLEVNLLLWSSKNDKIDFFAFMASLFAFNQSQTFCNSMLTTLYSDFKSLLAYIKFLSSAMRCWLHFIVTSNPCQHTASFYHRQIHKKSPLRRIINIINTNQEKIAKSPERQLLFASSQPFS